MGMTNRNAKTIEYGILILLVPISCRVAFVLGHKHIFDPVTHANPYATFLLSGGLLITFWSVFMPLWTKFLAILSR